MSSHLNLHSAGRSWCSAICALENQLFQNARPMDVNALRSCDTQEVSDRMRDACEHRVQKNGLGRGNEVHQTPRNHVVLNDQRWRISAAASRPPQRTLSPGGQVRCNGVPLLNTPSASALWSSLACCPPKYLKAGEPPRLPFGKPLRGYPKSRTYRLQSPPEPEIT